MFLKGRICFFTFFNFLTIKNLSLSGWCGNLYEMFYRIKMESYLTALFEVAAAIEVCGLMANTIVFL